VALPVSGAWLAHWAKCDADPAERQTRAGRCLSCRLRPARAICTAEPHQEPRKAIRMLLNTVATHPTRSDAGARFRSCSARWGRSPERKSDRHRTPARRPIGSSSPPHGNRLCMGLFLPFRIYPLPRGAGYAILVQISTQMRSPIHGHENRCRALHRLNYSLRCEIAPAGVSPAGGLSAAPRGAIVNNFREAGTPRQSSEFRQPPRHSARVLIPYSGGADLIHEWRNHVSLDRLGNWYLHLVGVICLYRGNARRGDRLRN